MVRSSQAHEYDTVRTYVFGAAQVNWELPGGHFDD